MQLRAKHFLTLCEASIPQKVIKSSPLVKQRKSVTSHVKVRPSSSFATSPGEIDKLAPRGCRSMKQTFEEVVKWVRVVEPQHECRDRWLPDHKAGEKIEEEEENWTLKVEMIVNRINTPNEEQTICWATSMVFEATEMKTPRSREKSWKTRLKSRK